mmetsp:Transcript_49417/g.145962  ORF Transcript_49417/g.145962 Transcript_49417/m.145962 type:complete len:485 (-) Transcript_49417:552-2006(-)
MGAFPPPSHHALREEKLGGHARRRGEVGEAAAAHVAQAVPGRGSGHRRHPRRGDHLGLLAAEGPLHHAAVAHGDVQLLPGRRHGEVRTPHGVARHADLAGGEPGFRVVLALHEHDAWLADEAHGGAEELADARGRGHLQGAAAVGQARARGLRALPEAALRQARALGEGAALRREEEAVLVEGRAEHLTEVLDAVELEGQGLLAERRALGVDHRAEVRPVEGHHVSGAVSGQDHGAHLLRPRDGVGARVHGGDGVRQGRRRRVHDLEEVGHAAEGAGDALGDPHDAAVLLGLLLSETAVAAAGVAPGLARGPVSGAGPGGHPRLDVRGPAHHAALLLQELALAVHVLEDAAADDEGPHGDGGDDGAAEDLPGEHRELRVAGLLGAAAARLLAGAHLLLEAGLAGLQVRGRGHDVDHVAEGGRHVAGGAARHVALLTLAGGDGQGEEADLEEDVDDVLDPAQEVDDAQPDRVRVEDAVVDRHPKD